MERELGKCQWEGILENNPWSSKDLAAHSLILRKVTLVHFVPKVWWHEPVCWVHPALQPQAHLIGPNQCPSNQSQHEGETMSETLPNRSAAYFLMANPANPTLSWKVYTLGKYIYEGRSQFWPWDTQWNWKKPCIKLYTKYVWIFQALWLSSDYQRKLWCRKVKT